MDPNALYSALNTIAQCSAALAALIGFLGLWRLDRLRAEREQALQLIYQRPYHSLGAGPEIARLGEEFFVQNAEAYVRELEQALGADRPAGLKLKQATARWRAIPGEQRQLIDVLRRFLRRTLVILALAISGLVVVDTLYSWVLTRWLTGLLIIVAAYRLGRDTYAVVREAARSARTLVILALVLVASPVLAGEIGQGSSPPQRTLIRSVPAGNVYSYENAAGETVEEMENRQGKLISRRFYRPTLPACAYLRSVGLATDRYWRDDGEQLFHCLSPMTPLGTTAEPYGLKNNLAYYVDGDAERAHKMLLKLNVNQRHEAKQAQQALLRAAKVLSQQALNTSLPKAAEQAIMTGKPWRGTVKASILELTREDWSTGKGYDLKWFCRKFRFEG